jgi:hypothetical protein
MVMAQSMARGQPPVYTVHSLEQARGRLEALPNFPTDVLRHVVPARDGLLVMDHMWIYPALAAPGVAVLEAVGVHPNYAFAALNVGFLLLAAGIVAARAGKSIALLVLGGVLIWWLDKAHTEVMTISLLASGVALVRERPFWSLAAIGLAAAQNIGAAPIVPLAALAAMAVRRDARDRAIWSGLAVAAVLVAIHVGWHWVMLGRLTAPITENETLHVPTLPEAGAWIWDSNTSLVAYAVPFVVSVIAALVMLAVFRPRSLARPEIGLTLGALVVLLFAFSQTNNVHAGGSVGPSRYSLWLLPLAIPILDAARAAFRPAFGRALLAAAGIACILALSIHRPIEREGWLRPTWLADVLWRSVPHVENPLPEIFLERTAGREPSVSSAAYGGCSKVLVLAGAWPPDCRLDVALPSECLAATVACYVNRTGADYVVTRAPERGTGRDLGD